MENQSSPRAIPVSFFDKASGLYYFNARWYDSELGKFTTSDPIRDGVNWWNYCNGNPLTRIDFTGLETAGYNHRQGNYDLLPKLQGIDTGNKWYNNLWDGFVSYGLEGTYNLFATAVNTFTNGIGATNELANMASEAVFGADIDSITMTMMANGMLAPAGIMLNGFNTYMNGLKLMNTSKAPEIGLFSFPPQMLDAGRDVLALPSAWNDMTHLTLFQQKPGTIYLKGQIAPQFDYGLEFIGGGIQNVSFDLLPIKQIK